MAVPLLCTEAGAFLAGVISALQCFVPGQGFGSIWRNPSGSEAGWGGEGRAPGFGVANELKGTHVSELEATPGLAVRYLSCSERTKVQLSLNQSDHFEENLQLPFLTHSKRERRVGNVNFPQTRYPQRTAPWRAPRGACRDRGRAGSCPDRTGARKPRPLPVAGPWGRAARPSASLPVARGGQEPPSTCSFVV